jgi:gliding motility-associated lipoprotein GldH
MHRFLFLIVPLMVFSCSESGKLADEMRNIPDAKWNYNQIPDFMFEVKNPNMTHNAYLKLRIFKDYQYENIYVLTHFRDSDGKIISTQKKNFTLTDSYGKPTGKASGNNINYELPLFENMKLNKAGKYFIAIEQNMRDSVILGVESIGIKVKEGNPVF